MNIIQIDGRYLLNRESLHKLLQDKLQLDEHYGHNLDALWDALTGEVKMPLTIRWSHFDISREKLGDYADQVLDLMREAEQEIDEFSLELWS
ncbi:MULTISPECIES: barstar family protein [Paenibacillus]|uniref:Barstar family protein n=1 Tax=Paenibacillus cucumis (ex Kampfer et al. 2016) TaxID=1776858 RepID=A0ABS7KIX3_9BACL|nr:barstar family protein [Paenibacillus cucumis (ex Kampfer et al. 2016)]MBY0204080.1 barstar family protein [Paenibacillus cucumis (ex Kampfer et al. 2016)]MDP9697885.1 ribonuclease inhibitor [Paenibacillus intestini]